MEKVTKTEELVDVILKLVLDQTAPEIKTLVGHRFPDDDVWLCCWMSKKFIPKAADAEIVFVNAGESLPGSEGNPSVLHFDTGGGEYDHHGRRFQSSSSAAILAKKLELLGDAGLKPLLEMVEAVDNVKPLPFTNLHYLIEGYRLEFRNTDGTIDWQKVQERVFKDFNIIYGQETNRDKSRKQLKDYAEWTTLPNGLIIASILWHPGLREAAFDAGAAVVIWTISLCKKRFYTGIQVNRNYSNLHLTNVAATLRLAEARMRGIDVRNESLLSLGRGGPITSWFLHYGSALILNGSRTWKPTEDELTRLSPRQIVGLVHKALLTIPREKVSQWNGK